LHLDFQKRWNILISLFLLLASALACISLWWYAASIRWHAVQYFILQLEFLFEFLLYLIHLVVCDVWYRGEWHIFELVSVSWVGILILVAIAGYLLGNRISHIRQLLIRCHLINLLLCLLNQSVRRIYYHLLVILHLIALLWLFLRLRLHLLILLFLWLLLLVLVILLRKLLLLVLFLGLDIVSNGYMCRTILQVASSLVLVQVLIAHAQSLHVELPYKVIWGILEVHWLAIQLSQQNFCEGTLVKQFWVCDAHWQQEFPQLIFTHSILIGKCFLQHCLLHHLIQLFLVLDHVHVLRKSSNSH
jgi:hypothetical protein